MFYLSPLVAVNEIDLTTTIPAVATSIGVTVLRNSWRGSEAKKEFSSSVDEFIQKVGSPTSDSDTYEDILVGSAFLKVADMLYHTRAMSANSTFSGTKIPSGSNASGTQFDGDALTLTNIFNDDPDYFGETTVTDSSVFWFVANSRGVWGNNLKIAIMDKTAQDQIISRDPSGPYGNGITTSNGGTQWNTYAAMASIDDRLQDNTEFAIIVYMLPQNATDIESNWELVEYKIVSLHTTATDDQGRNIFAETLINSESQYIRISVNPTYVDLTWGAPRLATHDFQQFGGGINSSTVTDGDIIDAFDLYADPEEVDVNLFLDSNKSETVKQYLVSLCDLSAGGRGDAMVILDPPYSTVVNNRGNETTDLVDWRRGQGTYLVDNMNVNSSYAALYGNWGEIYDKWSQKYRWIPLSGHVGGVYAYTDLVSDAWYAPAGLNRGLLSNIRRLAWNPNLGQRNLLYKNGINPITSFAGQGKVIWGQKTLLDKPSAFNRVNVRRLFIVLEKAISTMAKYFLFEPNTTFTRLQLKNTIDPYLRDVKARQGVYDYLVVCDETNNTAERIDRNELWCDIYIKPVRSAEFIVLNFIATKTGASFVEIQSLRAA